MARSETLHVDYLLDLCVELLDGHQLDPYLLAKTARWDVELLRDTADVARNREATEKHRTRRHGKSLPPCQRHADRSAAARWRRINDALTAAAALAGSQRGRHVAKRLKPLPDKGIST